MISLRYALKVVPKSCSGTPESLAMAQFAMRLGRRRVSQVSFLSARHPLTMSKPSSSFSTKEGICFLNIPKNCGAAICAPIVDEDDLIGLPQRPHHLCQPDIEPLCAAFFVEDRYDDRKPYPCLHFHRSYSDSVTWTSVPFPTSTIFMLSRPLLSTESMQQDPCSSKAGCHRTLHNS